MYSALVKIFHGFLHFMAMLIASVLAVAILAAVLQTPVEIASAYGIKWAHKIVCYFTGE